MPTKFRKKNKKTVATQDLDPAAQAEQRLLQRQRFLIARALRKRRRRKSHQ